MRSRLLLAWPQWLAGAVTQRRHPRPSQYRNGVPEVARALALAGLAEIGGGWLVWQFLRESRPWPFGLLGALVLIIYGVIVTFLADPHFGRV